MEKIKILGVDPSLRNTGLAVLTYDTETMKFSVPQHCRVLVNPQKYKGKDAILNMLDMMQEVSTLEEYQNVTNVLVESPGIMFNKNFSSSVVASLGHIAGGAAVIFGLSKVYLFRPSEWNKHRKKEVTHNQTEAVLGKFDTWQFSKALKSPKLNEHVLDAASLALWWIKGNYIDEAFEDVEEIEES